jgi:hypothetical protein
MVEEVSGMAHEEGETTQASSNKEADVQANIQVLKRLEIQNSTEVTEDNYNLIQSQEK